MEERKTIFDYLGQVLVIFGVSILVLIVLSALIGEDARDYSTMFALGSEGLTLATMLQFLLEAVIITILRFVLFTDTVIKKMPLAVRTGCMFGSVILFIVLLSALFGWFPMNDWTAWVSFLVVFAICAFISTRIMISLERIENKKLEKALQRAKGGS